ncbi:hypothetical protein ACG2LH_05445 [Zhouia sp. PK063]|uniref:hypothetical protein n=1 Tax=Zhouia sp. PK063 TaxID=3373602 RepID=UPI00378A4EF3
MKFLKIFLSASVISLILNSCTSSDDSVLTSYGVVKENNEKAYFLKYGYYRYSHTEDFDYMEIKLSNSRINGKAKNTSIFSFPSQIFLNFFCTIPNKASKAAQIIGYYPIQQKDNFSLEHPYLLGPQIITEIRKEQGNVLPYNFNNSVWDNGYINITDYNSHKISLNFKVTTSTKNFTGYFEGYLEPFE